MTRRRLFLETRAHGCSLRLNCTDDRTLMVLVVALELRASRLEERESITNSAFVWPRSTYLDEFDGNEFEAALFEALDDFTDESSLDTVVLDHDETVFACSSHNEVRVR